MKTQIISLLSFMLLFTFVATAQDGNKYGETEEQQIECKEALSVYRSFRDQDNLKDAYNGWQKAVNTCPATASERMFSDGAKFIRDILETEISDERKKALQDSLIWVYDQRIEEYGNDPEEPKKGCELRAYKAIDMARNIPGTDKEAYELLRDAIECLGDDANASVISYYYVNLYNLYKDAEGEERDKYNQELLTEYIVLQEIANNNMNEAESERAKAAYESAMGNLDQVFTIVSDCENMVPVLEKNVAAEPDNMELKEKVLRLMNQKDCTESDFYLEIAEAVHAENPTAPSAYGVGIGYVKKRELSKGLEYLEQAVELCAGKCVEKKTYLLKAAQVASALKRTSTAKQYANQVLEIDAKSGEAYLVIGDAITGASDRCDDGKLGSRAVYWLAYDYYQRAKSIDPSVAEKANQKMASARSQFPSKQDIFVYSLTEGSSFDVTCPWNETTTIRARP
ncbi:tetratricopeptide repeat protein [Halocola ammonii]